MKPIPNGTILKFRTYRATIVECLNPNKTKSQDYRYYVDTDKHRWSISHLELVSFNKENPIFLSSGYPSTNLK